MSQIERAHQHIDPQNVLVDACFKIKFAPVGTFPGDANSYQDFVNHDARNYMAPELLDRKMWGQCINWPQADMYAAGRTVLDAMSLELSPKLYNYHERLSFLRKQFANCARHGYSSQLCNLVASMIQENP